MTTRVPAQQARSLVVDRVAVLRHASIFAAAPGRVLAGLAARLDEVFFALTGHPAEIAADEDEVAA